MKRVTNKQKFRSTSVEVVMDYNNHTEQASITAANARGFKIEGALTNAMTLNHCEKQNS